MYTNAKGLHSMIMIAQCPYAHDDRVECYSHSQGTNVKIIWKVLLLSLWYDVSCTAKEPTGSVAVYTIFALIDHSPVGRIHSQEWA